MYIHASIVSIFKSYLLLKKQITPLIVALKEATGSLHLCPLPYVSF